jgi:hypothetical protein
MRGRARLDNPKALLRQESRKSDPVSLDTVSTTMTAAKEVVNASQAAEAFDSWQ